IGVVILLTCGAQTANEIDRVDTGELRVFREGRMRIKIGSSQEIGDSLIILDDNRLPQIDMMLHHGGKKTIVLDDRKNLCSASMIMLENGSFALHYSGEKKAGFSLMSNEGMSFLRFHDVNGKVRAKLGLDHDGSPSMEFYDKQEKITMKIPER